MVARLASGQAGLFCRYRTSGSTKPVAALPIEVVTDNGVTRTCVTPMCARCACHQATRCWGRKSCKPRSSMAHIDVMHGSHIMLSAPCSSAHLRPTRLAVCINRTLHSCIGRESGTWSRLAMPRVKVAIVASNEVCRALRLIQGVKAIAQRRRGHLVIRDLPVAQPCGCKSALELFSCKMPAA